MDEPAEPTLPWPERTDVRVATNRCPFCHDDILIEGSDWVACFCCQARHHHACWDESGACGSCGETRAVGEISRDLKREEPRAVALPTLSELDAMDRSLERAEANLEVAAIGFVGACIAFALWYFLH